MNKPQNDKGHDLKKNENDDKRRQELRGFWWKPLLCAVRFTFYHKQLTFYVLKATSTLCSFMEPLIFCAYIHFIRIGCN